MKGQFDWFVGEEDEADVVPLRSESGRWLTHSLGFLLVTAVITLALLTSWQIGQNRLEQSEADAATAVQSLLDLEHNAFQRGDGDLYFSFYGNDPRWIAAQLQPQNLNAARAGYHVTRAEAHDSFIWANLAWTIDQQTYQRIAFFQRQDGQLTHAPTAPDYWGSWISYKEPWGALIFTERDELWADAVASFIAEMAAEICEPGCAPFTLHLANDYQDTAVPSQLRIPSPRLIALDESGQPASLFWGMLRQRLEAHLTPATIRFAIPPPLLYNNQTIINYTEAAGKFMAAHPHISVELVQLETLPEDMAELATKFDGAAVSPTEEMLTAGLVHDLSGYIETDPDFDKVDFFPQIWWGAGWRGRVWFMPHAASMRVLYYDKAAYRLADLTEPSLRWTWDEMADDLAVLIPSQPDSTDLQWGFLDTGLDVLYAYAYNWNNQCQESTTVLCQNSLRTQNVAAALEWYSHRVNRPGQMPDLTRRLPELFGTENLSDIAEQMNNEQRQQFMLWNIQTSHREAAIWVDLPVEYERQLLLSNLGVVPFPGSDRFDGITPLWVHGSFISQGSERPLAVWQWLKFLSYQRPTPRLIPARPSVANSLGYWTYLPRPLGDAMRTAFPFARPVTIEEKTYITWEQVTAIIAGEATPLQAAQTRPSIYWFE